MKNARKIWLLVATLIAASCSNIENISTEQSAGKFKEEIFNTTVTSAMAARSSNDAEVFEGFASEAIIKNDNGIQTASNRAEYLMWMRAHSKAFPDGETIIEVSEIGEERAYTYWTFSGTNTGPLGNIAPSDKKVVNQGFSVWTFDVDGKVIQEDVFYDELVLRTQLGFTLNPPG